jgi:hypothetical protein
MELENGIMFEMNLLGCGARMVVAKVEENKREMKKSNNQ